MNDENELEKMIIYCKTKNYDINGSYIDASQLVFEERVKMNCFYCGKYNVSWRCPPKIPHVDFERMIKEFQTSALIYTKMSFDAEDYATVRNDSALKLHRALLECERWLWNNNNSTALSFIGGGLQIVQEWLCT